MRRLSGYGPSVIVLGTAMLVLFLGPSIIQKLTFKQTQARMFQASHRLHSDNNILGEMNQAYRDIATFVEPSVVHISAETQTVSRRRTATSTSAGSGWVFDEHGHIVTNYHVIADAERIEVQLSSGELREAEVVGFDQSTDIAVLRIPAGELHPAQRGHADDPVEQGDMVFAFGSPFNFRFSMSSGIVSGQGRHVGVIGREGYENFIQVDAAINPGNSGGPLTNFRGEVIGMNIAIVTGSTDRTNSIDEGQFAGIGLAIPLEMIEPTVSQIIDKGFVEKGFLGVRINDLDKVRAQQFGFIGDGVVLTWVDPMGPAGAAGVQAGDIVTHVNESETSNSFQLRSVVSSIMPGETVNLSLFRPDLTNETGEHMNISLVLASRQPTRVQSTPTADDMMRLFRSIGIEQLATATVENVEPFDTEFKSGVVIQKLVADSELSQHVEPGAIILEVMGYHVTSLPQFSDYLLNYDLASLGVEVVVAQPDGAVDRVHLRVQR